MNNNNNNDEDEDVDNNNNNTTLLHDTSLHCQHSCTQATMTESPWRGAVMFRQFESS